MATYKLIQDVEADDKLLGPLSFRQFIYALVCIFMLYVSFLLYTHHAEFLDIATLPIALGGGFFAFPFGKDQPTEVWALSKIRFFLKPRKRIWAQSGIKELVTITVPKKIEIQRTDGLSQTEVKSRLQALANTIDSRGWAVKNVSSVYQNPISSNGDGSDRLISAANLPNNTPDYEVTADEDLFDDQYNPIYQQVDQLLTAKTSEHHQELIEHLNEVRTDMASKVSAPAATMTAVSLPTDNEIESELKSAYTTSHSPLNNMHALRQAKQPAAVSSTPPEPAVAPQSTQPTDPVIMNLSQRNDLNVNVISHEADRAKGKKSSSDEVLISLH
ncbi:MAG TPA: PrgI family protein [Candidatus Saccharimonadales bacterium]|jgi:hypothetical protein